MITIYGIKNCDTVKKACKWFDAKGVLYQFHDFRKEGLSAEIIESWLVHVPWERVVNTRGTTYRKLTESEKAALKTAETGIALLCEYEAVIKRPVVVYEAGVKIGFSIKEYEEIW